MAVWRVCANICNDREVPPRLCYHIRPPKDGLLPSALEFYGGVMYGEDTVSVLKFLESIGAIELLSKAPCARVHYDSMRTGEQIFELPLYRVIPAFCFTDDSNLQISCSAAVNLKS